MNRRSRFITVLVICAMALCSCARKETGALVINGETVSQAEARYVMYTEASAYTLTTGNEIDWNEMIEGLPSADYIRILTKNTLVLARVLQEKAKEYGCLPDQEENTWITETVNANREAAGAEAFDNSLKILGGSLELYRRYVYERPLLEDKLFERLFYDDGLFAPTDETLETYHREDMVCCSYIYLSLIDDDGFRLTGEEYVRLKQVAEALCGEAAAAARSGDRETFFDMVRTHGRDYAMSVSTEGLTLPMNYHGEAFRTAVEAIGPGEVTDVVETQDGFYIIMRLEMQEDYLAQNREVAENAFCLDRFEEMKEQWCEQAVVEVLKGFEDIEME